MTANSIARQNFDKEVEEGINKQVRIEFTASYSYLSISAYFDRPDVSLDGFKNYFLKLSQEKWFRGQMLIRQQNKRGGRLSLFNIDMVTGDWESSLECLQTALLIEKNANEALLKLHSLAKKHKDAQMSSFLDNNFLTYQVDLIKKLAGFITELTRNEPGLGEYMFDKETIGKD